MTSTPQEPTAQEPVPDRPLVVVSNRLPFQAEREGGEIRLTRSPGGLVSALEPVLRQRGGTWIGWAGVPQEEGRPSGLVLPTSDGITYRAVPLTATEVTQYYGGFANRTLWPLFHYFLGQTQIDGGTWRTYERVNERFAQVAAAERQDGALVWVHDYQLLRVPHYLRSLAPDSRIAFFLHIPFPATEVFRVLPWSRSLLRGVLACDLVGFQRAGVRQPLPHLRRAPAGLRGGSRRRRGPLRGARGVRAGAPDRDRRRPDRGARRGGRRRRPQQWADGRVRDPRRGPPRLHQGHSRAAPGGGAAVCERYPAYRGACASPRSLVPSRERRRRVRGA